MANVQSIWNAYKESLTGSQQREFGELWADDCRLIVVYGKEEFGHEKYRSRPQVLNLFFGPFRAKVRKVWFENDVLHETRDPLIFFVAFDFNVLTNRLARHTNRILGQCTLNHAGQIAELVEYADPQRRQRLIDELMTSHAATKYAAPLIDQHLRGVSRYLTFYDQVRHLIPTNIDAKGNISNLVLDGMNQSRHLYGVVKAYELSNNARFLATATEMATGYTDRFVDRRTAPPCFFEEVVVADRESPAPPPTDRTLRAERQAYGLAGLVAYYGTTRDPSVLQDIRELHDAFVTRFHDGKHGGFVDRVDLWTGTRTETKSFNSTIYVATAYLFDLVEVEPDGARKQLALDLLTELADIVVEHFIAREMEPPGTGFIVENFSSDWTPDWRDWQRVVVDGKTFSISIVGHNTQAAWFLLRMYERTNVDKYKNAAIATLTSSLSRGFDWKNGGVYNGAKREEQDPAKKWMWGTSKAWWQQAETIQALIEADRLGLLDELRVADGTAADALEKTVRLWTTFERPEGGIFSEVDESGRAIVNEFESAGKGTYHEAQVADVASRAAHGQL